VVAYQCILTTFTDLILARFKNAIKVITTVLLIITTMGCLVPACSANELLPLITQAEDQYLIPRGLLLAISTIESGNRPYALNIAGKPVITTSKQEAVDVANHHLDQGQSNIDLGVMQLNFYWHGKYFKNIEEMLTPSRNINYGAKFLSDLYQQHGSWQKAVRYYHSSSPEHYKQYSRKVLISWLGV
jgi:soluble lytic murein transglycosylase-like protein